MKQILASFLLFAFLLTNCFAADAKSDSVSDEITFPQWAKDLRRTEIITFGSLPFVTLWVIVGYSYYEYGEMRNPLDKSTTNFTSHDQKRILQIAGLTCIGLGLTDLTFNIAERRIKRHKEKKNAVQEKINITPLSETNDIDCPPIRGNGYKEYLINGVIEDALF